MHCYVASGAQSDLVWVEPCPDAPGTKTTKGAASRVWLIETAFTPASMG